MWSQFRGTEFQSSPVPKDGCNPMSRSWPLPPTFSFQSSPVPKDGCNYRYTVQCTDFSPSGFNPHPSRRTGATCSLAHNRSAPSVSILTRPEGRVQLQQFHAKLLSIKVSILTRPEGRVQPLPPLFLSTPLPFQSSPVPKDGCNLRCPGVVSVCPRVSILTRPEGRVQLPDMGAVETP